MVIDEGQRTVHVDNPPLCFSSTLALSGVDSVHPCRMSIGNERQLYITVALPSLATPSRFGVHSVIAGQCSVTPGSDLSLRQLCVL